MIETINDEAYRQFVNSRAKLAPPGHPEMNLLHAAVGMVGEAVEALYAPDRDSLLKELGDFEFYLTFYREWVPTEEVCDAAFLEWTPQGIVSVLNILVAASTDMLDLCKKAWIYETPLANLDFGQHCPIVQSALEAAYNLLGTTQPHVRAMNVNKLMLRYPHGYSNHAAQTRADGTKDGR